jgi:dTDP-4-dehydrorhamnose 3,5-epimerase
MEVVQSFFKEVLILKTNKFEDKRGSFREQFNNAKFNELLNKNQNFVQDNISVSHKNVFRGFHYQIPFPQGKLVSVLNGSIIDYFIDMRSNSKNFCKYGSFELSSDDELLIWIPEGFAHGFLSLENNTKILYKTTDYYSNINEHSLHWSCPEINFKFPKNLDSKKIIISEKDNTYLPITKIKFF